MGKQMTTCEWIGLGELCSQSAVEGRSYCDHHLWLVYQKGTQLGKRRKDQRIANDVFLWQSLMDEAIQELEDEGVL